MSDFRLACPACNGPLVIRCSRGESPCVRSLWYQCKNLACGATFGGTQSIDYQLSPLGLEQPLMVLPLAPSRLKRAATQASRMTGDQRERVKDQATPPEQPKHSSVTCHEDQRVGFPNGH